MGAHIRAYAVPQLSGGPGDGIHLIWSPPLPAGFALDGFDIWRREIYQSGVEERCVTFNASNTQQLHRLHRFEKQKVRVTYRTIPIFTESPVAGTFYSHRYNVKIEPCDGGVSVEAEQGTLAVAIRDGKAIARERFISGRVTFYLDGIEEVVFYASAAERTFRVCCRQLSDDDWTNAVKIASGIQLPFDVHPDIASIPDAQTVINDRLISGESIAFGRFETMYEAMNDALAANVPLATVIQKHGLTASVFEIQIFGTIFGLTLQPEWRRALGFGYHDRAENLTANLQYDYRIDGSFYRRTLVERRHDFSSVPEGTTLPLFFQTGDVRWFCAVGTTVESIATHGSTFETLIKGIRPRRVTLEFAPTNGITLEFYGEASIQLRVGSLDVDSFTLTGDGRVPIRSAPFDTAVVTGDFLITACNENSPENEDAIDNLSAYVRFVNFADSPGPTPVDRIEVENLQRPGSASQKQEPPGFRVAFPPVVDPLWPVDLEYASPFTETYWRLERQRQGGTFEPYDGDEGIIVSSRGIHTALPMEGFGIDLEARFAADPTIEGSHTAVVFEDPFSDFKPGEIPFGERFAYRVASVDAIGRMSGYTSTGFLPLEKHLAPPRPGGPRKEKEFRSGIIVSLVASSDDLSPEVRESLGDADEGILVEWGWEDFAPLGEPPTERDRDPYVTEFRVYFRALEFIEVSGDVISISTHGDQHVVEVSLDSAVSENALAGQTFDLGYPFRIVTNSAGSRITIHVHHSSTGDTPRPRSFTLGRSDRDGGGPPASWDQRVAVIDFEDGLENYHAILPASLITIEPDGPFVRGFVGVSAADDAPYVPDTVAYGSNARPGNESFVSSAPILVEYVGRPEVVAPLGEVERESLRRARGDEIVHRLRFSSPPSWIFGNTIRVQRIKTMEVARRFANVGTQVYVLDDTSTETNPDLENPTALELPTSEDRVALQAGISTGLIDDRYIAFALKDKNFEKSWTSVFTGTYTGEIVDMMPNANAAWIYRVQQTDAKGRASADFWIVPKVVEVPPQIRPASPELSKLERTALDTFDLKVSVRTYDTLATVLLFATSVLGDTQRELNAKLVVVPNREDLSPDRTHRVKTQNGQFIAPVMLAPTDGEFVEDDLIRWTIPISNPPGAELQVWACSVHNGMSSTLVGPRRQLTKPR